MLKSRTLLGLTAGLLLSACATAGTGGGVASGVRDRNVITQQELAAENSTTVYEAIQHLRPEMLRLRPAEQTSSLTQSSGYTLNVYQDDNKIGDISVLHGMPLGLIREIRYLSPSQAMQRFGSGNPGGVIQLITH